MAGSSDASLADLAQRFQKEVIKDQLRTTAFSLGLSIESLVALGIGWANQFGAWSFPMYDENNVVRGIRLRRPNGCKFAVKGSKEGLFIPQILEALIGQDLFVCEGVTDAAAMLDLGFQHVVGRASCNAGVRQLIAFAKKRMPGQLIIVADSDPPGREGANRLASILVAYVPVVKIIAPPLGLKDAREWLCSGATRDDVERAISDVPPRRLSVRVIIKTKE
jgi:phage/plasmid primase-like uncharacterized protein